MAKVSALLITQNNESTIEACLESVRWVDEIIVVDALSKDRTPEIAGRYTDKVISRPWKGFYDQRVFSLLKATCEFVLIIDADETLDPEACNEVKRIINSRDTLEGYYLTSFIYFMGRPLYYAQLPHAVLRLFRREAGFVLNKPGRRGHEGYLVHGRTGFLKGRIRHYTANTIAERVVKTDRWSTFWAEERAEWKTRPPSAYTAMYAAARSLFGNFLIRQGFRDGFPGFVWCALRALENFLKYAKLWEAYEASDGDKDPA
ncbi:MAG: glycosyltransferase family 2 protein [Candidatus Omnitrophota bacterium]